jgi:ABC-type Zn uptake system ZnuABC Zn-binding protein ZnuA
MVVCRMVVKGAMRRHVRAIVSTTLALTLTAAACGDDAGSSSGSATAMPVVATTTVLADFATVIGGDRVHVYGVLKPNVDPHDFEPAPIDLDAMKHAKVIVKNGVGLEDWLAGTFSSSGADATVVDTSEGVAIRDADHGHGDPHIWHDPANAKKMVTTIAAAFSAADPEGAATYQAHLVAYTAQLDALDTEIAVEVATLSNKKLVTNHDAFGYFVDRYGLDYVGAIIPSFDTSAELSASDLSHLIAAIKAEGVKAVFSESSLPAKTAKTIADEAHVKVVAGEDALYGDSLGPAKSDGATYLTMMRHNATTIVTNLR